ncbi:Pre-mRNA splicing factor-domain-containing protein [Phlyctochytrium arcticum]|nr:Pre-mRNA splicing factor-domain-containing protein [Phlyctochytrium arcticum]
MGGGDLNLKKSWHPGTLRNQEKVWKKEREAGEEQKKLDQLLKEKNEERQLMELQALAEATGGKKRAERLDWMYSGAAGQNKVVDDEREAYLLGKKRVDRLVEQGQSVQEMDSAAAFQKANAYGMSANSVRDTQAKVREDPLLSIKRREQASLQSVLNNPVELKKLKESKKKSKSDKKSKKEKKGKKEKKEKREKRDKRLVSDSGSEEDIAHRSRNGSSYEEASRQGHVERAPTRRGHLSRSPSPQHRGRSRSPSPDYSRRGSYTNNSYRERPRASVQRRPRSRSPSRSRSPAYRRYPSSSYHRRRSPSRSPSPRRSRRSPSRTPPRRRLSPSPDRRVRRPASPPVRTSRLPTTAPPASAPAASVAQSSSDKADALLSSVQVEYEARTSALESARESRLAEMQKDAQDWDQARTERVELERKKQAEEDAKDLAARMKRLEQAGGSKGESFVRDMHRATVMQGTSAADMIKRNRAFVQRSGGDFMGK